MPLELVFIHGWGFDAHFWDALASRLLQFRQRRIDLGFFADNAPSPAEELHSVSQVPAVLVGHSLGFLHGIQQTVAWNGWIALNGFTCFIKKPDRLGCVTPAALRDMRRRLQNDPNKCLKDFCALIGAKPLTNLPVAERLKEGLDHLRDTAIEATLAKLRIPGLVLAGDKDPLVPVEMSAKLGHYAKDGCFARHEEGGHILPQSDPAWCAVKIEQYLTRHFL